MFSGLMYLRKEKIMCFINNNINYIVYSIALLVRYLNLK